MVKNRFIRIGLAMLIVTLLSACMYRGEVARQQANPAFIKEELSRVQSAIDSYYETYQVYPIKNSDASTPIYEKYVIDLKKLVQSNMLSSIPKNAFENGGTYYYLLITPETSPSIKLLDLSLFQRMADLQQKVSEFANRNQGTLPKGIAIASGYYSLDFKQLGLPLEQIQSFYSNNYLPVIIHDSGELFIDYGLELYTAVQSLGDMQIEQEFDLRTLLVESSPYVPIRSVPYYWVNGQPVPQKPN
jgi:hypothetical protein